MREIGRRVGVARQSIRTVVVGNLNVISNM